MYLYMRCILEAGFILIMKSSDADIIHSLHCVEFGILNDGQNPEIWQYQV
jgi:hypothetical protein